MAEWVGLVKTTAPKYLKGAEDETVRDRLYLAMLQKRGRILLNQSGEQIKWQVEAVQPPVTTHSDGGTIDFARTDAYQQASLPWRGYKAPDLMTSKEKEMNKGAEALIRRYDRIMPNLMDAIRDKIGTEMYIDGNAAGNEARFHGTESFMGTGTNVAADLIGEPSDTYAGLKTNLGEIETTWTSALTTKPNANVAKDWPDGEGVSGYDYWSPKLINWSSTGWTGTATFLSTAERCVRAANLWATMTGGKSGKPDVCLQSGNLYRDYLNAHTGRFRVLQEAPEMLELGFNGVKSEGVEITEEFGIAANTGYGVNFDKVTLHILGGSLFQSEGPTFSIERDSWLFLVKIFGNLCFKSPKGFYKLKDYA